MTEPWTLLDPDPDVDWFWDARPVLRHVHDFARARRVSPWACLGVVLARVVTATRPFHVLPPLVGTFGSLNLFVALVGPSGAGKGASAGAAADAVNVDGVEQANIGSGEGIAHLFRRRTKDGFEVIRSAVLMTAAEVDTLTALSNRSASTLVPELRKAWSGEALGFSYADPSRTLPIQAHSYRLSLVVGVQPGRAGPLLNDADAGTPQRFLWLPATDPLAPDVAPPAPEDRWWWTGHEGPVYATVADQCVFPLCLEARERIDLGALNRLRGNVDPLDGHALLARLKAAAALGVLDGRLEVGSEDWQLSEVLMDVSDRTRATVTAHLEQEHREENRRRGQAEGMRAAVSEEIQEQNRIQRICQGIKRKLFHGDWVAHNDLKKALNSRDREYFEDAVSRLLMAGDLDIRPQGNGSAYRVKVS